MTDSTNPEDNLEPSQDEDVEVWDLDAEREQLDEWEKSGGSGDTHAAASQPEIELKPVQDDSPAAGNSESESGEGDSEAGGELETLRKERDYYYDQFLRTTAEMDNLRKRLEREKKEHTRYANEELIRRLLPVLDNIERAMGQTDKPELNGEGLTEGVRIIYRQFVDELIKQGLQLINAMGEPFDPNYHEALMREETNEAPENTVIEQFERGYLFRDRLLRAAKVKVAAGDGATPSDADSSDQKESTD